MRTSHVAPMRAEAMFASALQRSDEPTESQVRAAVRESLRRYGQHGCAARVAQEFGDHPFEAVERMSWVLAALRSVAGRRIGLP